MSGVGNGKAVRSVGSCAVSWAFIAWSLLGSTFCAAPGNAFKYRRFEISVNASSSRARRDAQAESAVQAPFIRGRRSWASDRVSPLRMELNMNRLTKAAVIALALATTAAPMMAQAQDRHDRREWRQDRRDDRREWRQDRRDDRREWRQDRREWRQDRRHDRRDWRQDQRRHDRWSRDNRDWWRGRPEFRDYRGARNGYWYAPGHGYYRVEPRYYGYRWRTGGYLPSAYRNYYVSDPYFYGLRPAPRGYRYVHAGNDILMIAVATGLIASVMNNVY